MIEKRKDRHATKSTTVRAKKEILENWRREARERGLTLTQLIHAAIREFIQQ